MESNYYKMWRVFGDKVLEQSPYSESLYINCVTETGWHFRVRLSEHEPTADASLNVVDILFDGADIFVSIFDIERTEWRTLCFRSAKKVAGLIRRFIKNNNAYTLCVN